MWLNVVTCAKRRLYVIGNHETWGGERYFTKLNDQVTYCRRVGPGRIIRGKALIASLVDP